MTTLALTGRAAYLQTVVPVLLLGAMYAQGLAYLVSIWSIDQNYGHGFFIPFISLYLVWSKRAQLQALPWRGSWWGAVLVLAGLALYFVGELATLYVALHLSLWIVLVGLILAAGDWPVLKTVAFPLALLLVVIPLPHFLYQGLSGHLQLMSSQLGVGFLDALGVTALREGNVIDLGTTQLQVVEACSGLRYLFPFFTLALIGAYLFLDHTWKRVALVALSIPVSVGLNVFRIATTGILVDHYGPELAEGFFHAFSGWLLFVCGLALLGLAGWVLGARGLVAAHPLAPPAVPSEPTPRASAAYMASLALLACSLLGATGVSAREEVPPPRTTLAEFPLSVDGWVGRSVPMETVYLDALRFDDYLLADYRHDGEAPVNVYIAYYASQRKGESAHSPRTCLPGGGWEVASLERTVVASGGAVPLAVNRAVIQKDSNTQVVWYWFQERGRILTNEYLVKFYLLWDAVANNRTDGALVRLTTAVQPNEDEAQADRRLAGFVGAVRPMLSEYIPE